MLSNKHFFFCNCSHLNTAMHSFANRKAKQPRDDWHRWFFRSGWRCWVLPFQHHTIQASPKYHKPNTVSSSPQTQLSQPRILSKNYHLLFWVFLPPLLHQSLWQFGSQFCFPLSLKLGRDDFWWQDYGLNSPNIWYCFDGSQPWKLLCRGSGFGSQALQELLDVCLSKNSSTDNAWVLGLQKLSQCNLAAPVLIASGIRNAPFFPFSSSCGMPGSAHESTWKQGWKGTQLLLHKWHCIGITGFSAQ